MPSRKINLQFPLLGKHAGLAYQTLAPYSSPLLRNVWARATLENRLRGGSRPGILKEFDEQVSGSAKKIWLTADIDYIVSGSLVTRVVASANGEVWMEDASGDLIDQSCAVTLANDRMLQAVQYGQKLYIADYASKSADESDLTGPFYFLYMNYFSGITVTGVKDNGTTTVTASTGTPFTAAMVGDDIVIANTGTYVIASYTSATIVVVTGDATCSAEIFHLPDTDSVVFGSTDASDDFTSLGIDATGEVLSVANPTAKAGLYQISSVTTHHLVLTTPGSTDGNDVTSWFVQRGPKIFDPSAATLSHLIASSGISPTGCAAIALYRDRLVLSAAVDNPQAWYMARQSDPTDFDYTQTDAQAAVAGSSSDAGEVAQPVKALMPFSDDYLMFGSTSSLWRLRGDPAYGGVIDAMSRVVGVVNHLAWCQGPGGAIYILSLDGMYILPPGAQGFAQALSRERLPQELINIDTTNYHVNLVYDEPHRGIHIYITHTSTGGANDHWWFDLENKGFFPERYPANYEPVSVLNHVDYADGRNNKVLMGCRDGYVRSYSDDQTTDDGTEIASYVVYGPVRLGQGDYRSGVLTELVATLGQGLGVDKVNYEVIVAETGEEAVDACTDVAGTQSGLAVYSSTTELSTITATTAVFTRQMVGRRYIYGTSGTAYVISSFTSTTIVVVDGDASAEASGDTFTVSGIFESGTWERGRNISVRPHAGGGAMCLRLSNATGSDYAPFAIENILATIQSRRKQRVF